MVHRLREFYDAHGTWSVPVGLKCQEGRLDIWLSLRKMEYKKLKVRGILNKSKLARLRQLALIGYDFDVVGGPDMLLLEPHANADSSTEPSKAESTSSATMTT